MRGVGHNYFSASMAGHIVFSGDRLDVDLRLVSPSAQDRGFSFNDRYTLSVKPPAAIPPVKTSINATQPRR